MLPPSYSPTDVSRFRFINPHQGGALGVDGMHLEFIVLLLVTSLKTPTRKDIAVEGYILSLPSLLLFLK